MKSVVYHPFEVDLGVKYQKSLDQGWYWESDGDFGGPFATAEDAQNDMNTSCIDVLAKTSLFKRKAELDQYGFDPYVDYTFPLDCRVKNILNGETGTVVKAGPSDNVGVKWDNGEVTDTDVYLLMKASNKRPKRKAMISEDMKPLFSLVTDIALDYNESVDTMALADDISYMLSTLGTEYAENVDQQKLASKLDQLERLVKNPDYKNRLQQRPMSFLQASKTQKSRLKKADMVDMLQDLSGIIPTEHDFGYVFDGSDMYKGFKIQKFDNSYVVYSPASDFRQAVWEDFTLEACKAWVDGNDVSNFLQASKKTKTRKAESEDFNNVKSVATQYGWEYLGFYNSINCHTFVKPEWEVSVEPSLNPDREGYYVTIFHVSGRGEADLVLEDAFMSADEVASQLILRSASTKNQKTRKAESFNTWFDRFLEEKGTPYASWEIQDSSGMTHFINSDVVIEQIKYTSPSEQAAIKNMLVQIDFANGDIQNYFKFLAQALVDNF